jgi:hypothetical protein
MHADSCNIRRFTPTKIESNELSKGLAFSASRRWMALRVSSKLFFLLVVLGQMPTNVISVVHATQEQGALEFRKIVKSGVGQKPAFTIDSNEIRSIALGKVEVNTLANGRQEKSYRNSTGKSYRYRATLTLVEPVRKKFAIFANANDGQLYELRYGSHRLSVIQFVVPSGGFDTNSAFAFYLESTSLNDLKQIFSPIKKKIVWE